MNTCSSVITPSNIKKLTHIDLTQEKYHGGSTLSSGALPKWDLLDNSFMVKRCTIDDYGNNLTDATFIWALASRSTNNRSTQYF